ncbi:hypothetical protein VTN02DRAFT_1160 [Thermoascus thermophilus]
MAATVHHAPQTLGPIHPAKVEKSAVKPSIARKIAIRVLDPLDHDAPAILHEPRSYNATQANGSAVVLISGAGGGECTPRSRTRSRWSSPCPASASTTASPRARSTARPT